MVQFVNSTPIAKILAENNSSLIPYLSSNTMEIPKPVMETFVRSTAGYCVMTYILGVGDRHLDNLMISPTGHLLHIDFGYILGRDPKFMQPPFRLCKEMVEVMQGLQGKPFIQFKQYAYISYNLLRKNANLILNLFSLMVESNLPDIAVESDKCVSKVQDRFRLDLNDEMAIDHFDNLITESIGFIHEFKEQLHKVAQLFKS